MAATTQARLLVRTYVRMQTYFREIYVYADIKASVYTYMTLAGLEPAIFGSEDQRLIH